MLERALAVATVCGVMLACTPVAEELDVKKNQPGPKKPHPVYEYARGPALTPVDALVKWLDAQVKADGSKRLVRFPVTVESEIGAPRKAWIGAAGGLAIDLDDTALGISLDSHTRRHAGADKRAGLLVEGYWSHEAGKYRLHLRRVHGAFEPGREYAEVVSGEPVTE